MNNFELTKAAAQAGENLEDAGFYFLAAQTRYKIDKQLYPPVGKGGDSPGILRGALGMGIGSSLMPRVMNSPEVIEEVVKQLANWKPEYGPRYDPGWEYENPLGRSASAKVVATEVQNMLAALQPKLVLVKNVEYRQLAEVVAETLVVEREFGAQVNRPGGLKSMPEDLKEKASLAAKNKTNAATRMKEIEWELVPESRWHNRMNWKSEEYFDDPAVIALCDAIATDDIKRMERLIADGADVNAIGRDNMTPLMWAFPEVKLARFKCLLEHGASPNVLFESDFGVGKTPFHPYATGGHMFGDSGCHAGQSVMHLAARCRMKEYLELVLNHGGNPNLIDAQTGQAPLDLAIDRHRPDSDVRVQWLIDADADVNHYCKYVLGYPAMQAVQIQRYDVALMLLQAGADPMLFQPDGLKSLVHVVVGEERHLPFSRQKLNDDFQAMVQFLEAGGVSLQAARDDNARWSALMKDVFSPEAVAQLRQKLIKERETASQSGTKN